MSRAARITVGAVVAGTLAFVAVVAGVMSVSVSGAGPGVGFLDDMGPGYLDTYATAEVLDVDDEWDWPTVDVRWTTPDGELVVTAVDWEWTEVLPEVGDDVEVVYDSADPEWGAFAADDPYVDNVWVDGADDQDEGSEPAADDGVGRAAGWVSLGSLLALVVTVVATVVAAVRAPVPAERRAPAPGPYGPPAPYAPYAPSGSYGPAGPPSRAGQPYLSVPPPGYSQPRTDPAPPSGRGDGWSAP